MRCSWVCPRCGQKNTRRSSQCKECAWVKDGLDRKPTLRAYLRNKGAAEEDIREAELAAGIIKEYVLEHRSEIDLEGGELRATEEPIAGEHHPDL